MKSELRHLFFFTAIAVLAGCDWEAYNSDTSWTDNGFSWVSLTGTYRAQTEGMMLVLDPTVASRLSGSAGTTNTVTGEVIAYGNASSTLLEGILDNPGIVPTTLSIAGAGYVFTDRGNGSMTGTAGATGSVVYATGRWSLDFLTVAPDVDAEFIARYQWTAAGMSATNESARGNSGPPIYLLSVEQTGNRLTFLDNNGDRYDGSLLSVSTTGSGSTTVDDTTTEGSSSSTLIAPYQVTGLGSKANVTINGQFLGTYVFQQQLSQYPNSSVSYVEDATTSAYYLLNRTVTGTWLEHDPAGNVIRTGDIIGVADVEQGGQTTPNQNGTDNPMDPLNPYYDWWWYYLYYY